MSSTAFGEGAKRRLPALAGENVAGQHIIRRMYYEHRRYALPLKPGRAAASA